MGGFQCKNSHSPMTKLSKTGMEFRYGSMLDSKSENTTTAMRFADITQSKINSIIRDIKDGSNRRPNFSIDEDASNDGTKLFHTDREGRREVLGSLEAKWVPDGRQVPRAARMQVCQYFEIDCSTMDEQQ